MSFFKSVRKKAGRFMDELQSPSSGRTNRTGSSQPQSTLVSGQIGQMAINNNNSNINYNAPGGSIVNNNNSVTYVLPRDEVADDLDTIEKALGHHHVPSADLEAQPLEAGCMEGTRVQLLDNLKALAISRGGAHIIWVAGMAGTGKTSIALTLCRRLVKVPSVLLGGTFFCSRSAGSIDRTDARRIIPTLVILLARQVPKYAQALAAELKKDPDLASKVIGIQVQLLLVKPLKSVVKELNKQIVFVIDALDECADQNKLAELIDTLADFKTKKPIKFVFMSRPEMRIRGTSITDTSLSSIVQLHMVDIKLVTSDIRLYLKRSFEKASKSSSWYTDEDLDDLAVLSAGLFIFASTALAYIIGQRMDAPGRSARLLTVKQQASTSALATAHLDKIYSLVLIQASNLDAYEPMELEETRRIVAVILSTRAPLTIKALAELLELSPEHLRGALDELHAVVFVPEQDEVGELRTLHASFGDFIFTRAPEHIRIEKSRGHRELAHACLQRLAADDLCFNISRSHSSYKPNPESKPDWIAQSLIYACLHWAHHIALASESSSFDEIVISVLHRKLLFWLETLSVMGEVGHASGLLRIAAAAVTLPEVSRFLRDANSFVTSSHEAIKRSAPHIYLSALPFVPKGSLVHQIFSPLLTGIPVIETFGINRNEGHCVMVLAGHTGGVATVAYSPGGKVLASGSYDGTVRLWDAFSGAEMCSPRASDAGTVVAVACTPRGDRLIAGTKNGSFIVWDADTGIRRSIIPPLHLRTDRLTDARHRTQTRVMQTVAISPDGGAIASALVDGTIAFCHLSAGQTVDHIHRHQDGISSSYILLAISFSPDGTTLASAQVLAPPVNWRGTIIPQNNSYFLRNDQAPGYIYIWDYRQGQALRRPLPVIEFSLTIALSHGGTYLACGTLENKVSVWDARNAQKLRIFSGHQDIISSVAIAPNGRTLASASQDLTVRIWNLHDASSDAASLVLRGHSKFVNSVSFSKDGQYVASGSDDGTVRIWSAIEGGPLDMLMDGHADRVTVVAFSHGGRLIASASADGSAHVWDTHTCQKMHSLLDKCDYPVKSIAFSLDDRWIATGSEDTTIQLWDAQTGVRAMPALRGHAEGVACVVFAPNGLNLASGSADATVRIWEVASGRPAELSLIRCESGPFRSEMPVHSVAYSLDGKIIAVGGPRGDVLTFDVLTGEVERSFTNLADLARQPSESRFMDLRDYGILRLSLSPQSVCFPPDGNHIIAASVSALRMLDALANKRAEVFQGHPHNVNAALYSPDGIFIASGPDYQAVRLWDPTTLECLDPALYGHADAVTTISISSDGRFLVSGSKDKTIRLWDLEKIRSLMEDRGESSLTSLAFARYDGGWLVSPSDELLLWVPPEFRGHLEIGGHSRIIATHRAVVTADDDVLHQGEQWTRCWRAD